MLGLAFAAAMQVRQQVDLCAVLRRPSTYRHRVVSIPAEVLLAWPHGAMVVDKRCRGKGLGLGRDLPDADDSAERLVSDIFHDCAWSSHRGTVPGVFTGRVAYTADGRLEFRLLSVQKLQTKPCPVPTPPEVVMGLQMK